MIVVVWRKGRKWILGSQRCPRISLLSVPASGSCTCSWERKGCLWTSACLLWSQCTGQGSWYPVEPVNPTRQTCDIRSPSVRHLRESLPAVQSVVEIVHPKQQSLCDAVFNLSTRPGQSMISTVQKRLNGCTIFPAVIPESFPGMLSRYLQASCTFLETLGPGQWSSSKLVNGFVHVNHRDCSSYCGSSLQSQTNPKEHLQGETNLDPGSPPHGHALHKLVRSRLRWARHVFCLSWKLDIWALMLEVCIEHSQTPFQHALLYFHNVQACGIKQHPSRKHILQLSSHSQNLWKSTEAYRFLRMLPFFTISFPSNLFGTAIKLIAWMLVPRV